MHEAPTPEEEKRYAELQQMALDFARAGDTASLEPMLAAGLPVNLADHKGNSLLMLAAYNGNEETVKMLLRHGADPDRRNDRGQTPLGGVAFKGYSRIARLLLDAGADVNADNGGGSTPLMYATFFGRAETAALLRERGGDFGSRKSLGLLARLFSFPVRLFAAVLRGNSRSAAA